MLAGALLGALLIGGGDLAVQVYYNGSDNINWTEFLGFTVAGAFIGLVISIGWIALNPITATTTLGGANAACGGDMCASEVQDAEKTIEELSPQANNSLLYLAERDGPPFWRTIEELYTKGIRAYMYDMWQYMKLSLADATNNAKFPTAFQQAMNNSTRIYFDITGLRYIEAWQKGPLGPFGTANNVTNWEFYQVMTHPEWLGKTIFIIWEDGVLKMFGNGLP